MGILSGNVPVEPASAEGEPMRNDHDEDDYEESAESLRTPKSRVYVHTGCGGRTQVSGGDYSHICDPFWPCTSTYCCGCGGFISLSEVRWADTREVIARYRRRLRAETPAALKAWRYGLGFLPGGVIGAGVGLLVGVASQAPPTNLAGYALIGALVAGAICYLLGTFLLNLVFGIDYRRMR
jgi:hypothetical protein